MGVNSASSAASGSTNDALSSSTTGRDRAIEALYDSEPSGSFIRAAKLLDDVTPVTILSNTALLALSSSLDTNASSPQHRSRRRPSPPVLSEKSIPNYITRRHDTSRNGNGGEEHGNDDGDENIATASCPSLLPLPSQLSSLLFSSSPSSCDIASNLPVLGGAKRRDDDDDEEEEEPTESVSAQVYYPPATLEYLIEKSVLHHASLDSFLFSSLAVMVSIMEEYKDSGFCGASSTPPPLFLSCASVLSLLLSPLDTSQFPPVPPAPPAAHPEVIVEGDDDEDEEEDDDEEDETALLQAALALSLHPEDDGSRSETASDTPPPSPPSLIEERVPATHVVRHLLKIAQLYVLPNENKTVTEESTNDGIDDNNVSAGLPARVIISSHLLAPNSSSSQQQQLQQKQRATTTTAHTTLKLLSSLLILIHTRLRPSPTPSPTPRDDDSNPAVVSRNPSGNLIPPHPEDDDDNDDDDAEQSILRLEEKGLTRKAAAAREARVQRQLELKVQKEVWSDCFLLVLEMMNVVLREPLHHGSRDVDGFDKKSFCKCLNILEFVSEEEGVGEVVKQLAIKVWCWLVPRVHTRGMDRWKVIMSYISQLSLDDVTITKHDREILQELCLVYTSQKDILNSLLERDDTSSSPISSFFSTTLPLLSHHHSLLFSLYKSTWHTILSHLPTSTTTTLSRRSHSLEATTTTTTQPLLSPSQSFNPTKCPETISLIPSSSIPYTTAHQRASKSWGTVLSGTPLPPRQKSRFAVRLDTCDKGHVFIGVATIDCSVRTYVGGDRHGWGVIGTQALWHDRSKMRGDYGGTFRSGSVVIVTVDLTCGGGKVSFGLWNEEDGSVADWGVAFDDLEVESGKELYPAVGLYQRDDKVTILSVRSDDEDEDEEEGGGRRKGRRQCEEWMVSTVIQHEKEVLKYSHGVFKNKTSEDDVVVQEILPAIVARLNLIPPNVLSPPWGTQMAWELLSPLKEVIRQLLHDSKNNSDHYTFGTLEGHYLVRIANNSSQNHNNHPHPLIKNEYRLSFVPSSHNQSHYNLTGRGIPITRDGNKTNKKERYANASFSMKGCVNSSHLTILQEWRDDDRTGSDRTSEDENDSVGDAATTTAPLLKSIIEGQITLDGNGFDGVLRTFASSSSSPSSTSTVVPVAGVRLAPPKSHLITRRGLLLVLLQSYGHLCVFLGKRSHHSVGGASVVTEEQIVIPPPVTMLVSGGLKMSVSEIQELMINDNKFDTAGGKDNVRVASSLSLWNNLDADNDTTQTIIRGVNQQQQKDRPLLIITPEKDSLLIQKGARQGSLSRLLPDEFTIVRRLLLSLLHHFSSSDDSDECLVILNQKAVSLIETQIRSKIQDCGVMEGCRRALQDVKDKSLFLLKCYTPLTLLQVDSLVDCLSAFFSLSSSTNDVLRTLGRICDEATRASVHLIHSYSLLGSLLRELKDADASEEAISALLSSSFRCSSAHPLSRGGSATMGATSLLGPALLEVADGGSVHQGLVYTVGEFYKVTARLMLQRLQEHHFETGLMVKDEELMILTVLQSWMVALRKNYEDEILQDIDVDNVLAACLKRCSDRLRGSVAANVMNDKVVVAFSSIHQEVLKTTLSTIHILFLQRPSLRRTTLIENAILDSFSLDDKSNGSSVKEVPHWELWTKECLTPAQQTQLVTSNASHEDTWNDPQSKIDTEDYRHRLFSLLLGLNSVSTSFCRSLVSHICRPTLSSRTRVRIVRFLQLRFSRPTNEVIEKLLDAIATNNDENGFDDADVVRVAIVSLLRYWHAMPELCGMINSVLLSKAIETGNGDDMAIRHLGVIFFCSGMPSRLTIGRFVLVKPLMTSGKTFSSSSSSSNSSSHGNDSLNPVLAGLSRHTALAGMVSGMDETSHTVEVVLLPRSGNANGNASTCTDDEKGQGEKPRVTVRAVRVNAIDVVPTDERGLVVNAEMLPLLKRLFDGSVREASRIIFSATENNNTIEDEEKPQREQEQSLLYAAYALRGATVLLSHPPLLKKYLTTSHYRDTLGMLLSIASHTQTSTHFLPHHETNLLTLLSSLHTLRNLPCPETLPPSPLLLPSSSSPIPPPPPLSSTPDDTHNTDTGNSGDDSVSTTDTNNDPDRHEAAVAQMAELGLPRSWAELALRRTNHDVEAAVHFCLERGGDMERLLAEERLTSSSRPRGPPPAVLLRQLLEMGFPSHWCAEALAATRNNVDEALTWILTNGERLSQEPHSGGSERGGERGDDEDEGEMMDDDDDIDDDVVITDMKDNEDIAGAKDKVTSSTSQQKLWSKSLCPLRFVSGRSRISPTTLSVSGLPSGGFSSVGTKGTLLTSGKWYYEAHLITAGCLQIGWADGSFAGHCRAERGDGVGDGPSSWAFDGWRRYRWHSRAVEWGVRWSEGDVIGCAVDLDEKRVSFFVNGRGEEVGMGVAFEGEGFRPVGGVYACVSFNRRESLRLVLGGDGEEFLYCPDGYRGVGEAVLEAVQEREVLLTPERNALGTAEGERKCGNSNSGKPYLCDFSDGEHGHELFAWQHRYYGSDASVHLGTGKKEKKDNAPKIRSLNQRLTTIWRDNFDSSSAATLTRDLLLSELEKGYQTAKSQITAEIKEETLKVSLLHARKLILHLIVTLSPKFSLDIFSPTKAGLTESRQLLHLMEKTNSSNNHTASSWVGEASAMALSAEMLGLGISPPPSSSSYDSSSGTLFPSGTSVNLTCVIDTPGDCGRSYVAASEWSFGGSTSRVAPAEGFCDPLSASVFLREGLASALRRSPALVSVFSASVRRAVRTLAVVQFDGNDGCDEEDSTEQQDDEANTTVTDETNPAGSTSPNGGDYRPDARLASFLTSLLFQTCPSSHTDLFEAWSIALLSASAPWRMVGALVTSHILSQCPHALTRVVSRLPTLRRYYKRLESTVVRRLWAERAANPIMSRYLQSLLELRRACVDSKWRFDELKVDAATPLPYMIRSPLSSDVSSSGSSHWEWEDGFVTSDENWEVWAGVVTTHAVDWKAPPRSPVRALMDGGEGPPLLREGCTVMRGVDWEEGCDDDGKELYELEKKERDREAKKQQEESPAETSATATQSSSSSSMEPSRQEQDEESGAPSTPPPPPEDNDNDKLQKRKKRKKNRASPRLPIGTVLSIEPHKGLPHRARRVKWNLTNKVTLHCYGGDGGRYELSHVEVNEKGTRIRRRHPPPESVEQCAARHGFGLEVDYHVVLRWRRRKWETTTGGKVIREGILEYPDFGAGVAVTGEFSNNDDTFVLKEERLLYGSHAGGWYARFGSPEWRPTTTTLSSASLTPSQNGTNYQGQLALPLPHLIDKSTMAPLSLRTTYRFSSIPQFQFDPVHHSPTLLLSRDHRTITSTSSDRATAYTNLGVTKGVAYFEIRIEQADIGSVYVGIAEKSVEGGSVGCKPHRWHGWGFVNFRATYTAGAERVYGAHCHSGDTVGVLVDADAGRVSFFYDGLKYGEHILSDLGCAFENLGPFGFNADGCGGGGGGMGAPSAAAGVEGGSGGGSARGGGRYPSHGHVRPRTLWAVVGLRTAGDRVTLGRKWVSGVGVDGVGTLRNVGRCEEMLGVYHGGLSLPDWLVQEGYSEYQRWISDRYHRAKTRGSGPHFYGCLGLDMDIDRSYVNCAAACACLGLDRVLLPGDKVSVKRSAGRLLELTEEATILGACQGKLWYEISKQKSEGGSLTEGGGRAWFWDESEVVKGGLVILTERKGSNVKLPVLAKFQSGPLKIVYVGGAVIRSDLEIFDGSQNIGTIPQGEVIEHVMERRMNSCGVVRFRVKWKGKEGWISERIRGGKEEAIVEMLDKTQKDSCDGEQEVKSEPPLTDPMLAAKQWLEDYERVAGCNEANKNEEYNLTFQEYDQIISSSTSLFIPNSMKDSDAILSQLISTIADFSHSGDAIDCRFDDVAPAITFAIETKYQSPSPKSSSNPSFRAACDFLNNFGAAIRIPPLRAVLARAALLRAINRRLRFALPYLPTRSCHDHSLLLEGIIPSGDSCEDSCYEQQLEQHPTSIASRLRSCRRLLFTCVKKNFLNGLIDATTTPTPLSHDEYELPREVRTVRVNRLKARRALYLSSSASSKGDGNSDNKSKITSSKKKHAVFTQLQHEMRGWSGAALRRGFVAKGHGGQKRAFKVKLIGEGVNDYSGPYREVFTDAMREIGECEDLGVLSLCPNGINGVGEERGVLIFGSGVGAGNQDEDDKSNINVTKEERALLTRFKSSIGSQDELARELEENLVFLGRLVGTACRHNIPVDLPLPLNMVWKKIVNDNVTVQDMLKEVDILALKSYEVAKQQDDSTKAIHSSLLATQSRLMNFFIEGLASVLPAEILSLFTGEELRSIICGNPNIDVDLLHCVVEYDGGYNDSTPVIQYFWEVLQDMSARERKLFLQFVWSRSRLPAKESDFEGTPFKIMKSMDENALPSASTCFFSLTLPEYSSKEVLRQKLLFAIENVPTMESDYVTNDAEVGEGWRGI